MSDLELEDENELTDNTLNIDDSESSEQLKSRKTITNTTRSMEEFNHSITGTYDEEFTNPITGEKYTVTVKVLVPQPNPSDRQKIEIQSKE